MKLRARLYRQFDADYARPVPGEGYGGWHTVDAELAPAHTALVVMHAWDCGEPSEFPGWRRAVEYTPRARQILAIHARINQEQVERIRAAPGERKAGDGHAVRP